MQIVVIIGAILLAGFDVYLALDKRPGNTYSEIIKKWSVNSFAGVAYLLGYLNGHFFFDTGLKFHFAWSLIILIIGSVGFSLIVKLARKHAPVPKWVPIAIFVIGFIAGGIFFNLSL